MKWLWVATLISLSALQAGECIAVESERSGRVEITAFDRLGSAIRPAPTQLVYPSGKVAYDSPDGTFKRVEYGTYGVVVRVTGFRTVTIPTQVAQRVVNARVPLIVGSIGCPERKVSIRGRILSGHPYTDLWLKAMPIRGAGATEAKVDEKGFFEISGLEAGDYFVVVTSGHMILSQATVKYQDKQPLELELPKL